MTSFSNFQSDLNLAVEFKNVTKTFGEIVANKNINFSVPKGSIRALIGENGAGKSTAMKILFGLYKEDSGEIRVNGKPQHWRSPKDAIKNGIGMVHQHFMLAETATALDNIILGEEYKSVKFPFIPTFLNFVDRKTAKNKIEILAKKYGLSVPLNVKISSLPVGIQQRVEILKLLYRNADILILDEPTAVLTPPEVDELFENLKKLKNEGKTIIIVTHKLKEVLNFTDTITVFRGGEVVGNLVTSEANEEKIAAMMVGRNINLKLDIPMAKNLKQSVFRMEDVNLRCFKNKESSKEILSKININVNGGEIVGMAGVEGNGQSEILNLLFHPEKYFNHKIKLNYKAFGKVFILGKEIALDKLLKQKRESIGFIPEDRQDNGLLMGMNVGENYILGRHWEKIFRYGLFQNKSGIKKSVLHEIEKYGIKPQNIHTNISNFSGGNQQKLIIAREIGKNPQFIVAANPTRGVDIGAIDFIHRQIIEQRDKGVGILLISSELDEIIKLSDKILVAYNGKIVAEFKRHEADEHTIGLTMCGGKSTSGEKECSL